MLNMNIVKHILTILLALAVSSGFSQNKKYQGLLWEITGNGISEASYLYGTMHVSNKLAFNVSDSFYLCLNSVKGIALESSPDTWMDEYRDMNALGGGSGSYGDDFYRKAFKIESPKTEVIYDLLENKNGLMNQILYRFKPGNEDYQENTFLDMFIFQAGSKKEKPIYSLETMEEVMELSYKSMEPDKDKKRDNSNNNYLENDGQRKYLMLEEAYRRGDLDQIDSLSKANNPTSVYHKYFIVERNRNMVRRMDSIMHIHSIFTGIGAAHLPGEEGAINLLIEMGYKVRPVSQLSTGKAQKMRKNLEELYLPVEFVEQSTTDKFINVAVPGTLYEMPTNKRGKMEYLCPEPINGGYFSIIRLFTFGPIYNHPLEYYKSTFDSLLYIATPGEIMKKEDIVVNGHQGYNILTKTSKNAFVNYNVFFTPTEIIVFKGSGIDEYIKKAEPQSFFNKINLAPKSSEWQAIKPRYEGAQWKMKGMVSGQDMIEKMDETLIDPIFQSYDDETKDYYLVMRYSFNDLDYIEEDSFDLAFLGQKFGEKLGYEVNSSNFYNSPEAVYVKQKLKKDEKHKDQADNLSLKVITKGGLYYLMCTTSQNTVNIDTFFDSFEFTDFIIDNEYETYEDTTMFYSASILKHKDKPDYPTRGYNNYYKNYGDEEEDKTYLGSTETKVHYSVKANESVYVGYSKFHNYSGADSISDFWDYRRKRLAKEHLFIVSREERGETDGDPTYSFILSDTGSAKGIMTHLRLHHGVLYTLQSLIDTTAGPSEFVSTFFKTFAPMDTLIGRDIFEDKAKVFFEHVNGTDSLNRVNAMKSVKRVDFEEKDVAGVVKTYREYEFDEDTEIKDREKLIMTLGNIETQEAYDFLNEVFEENNFSSDLQFIVLKCFSYTETEEAYDAIQKLLIDNTPFSESKTKLTFFNSLYDSLELARGYFPEMLDLSQYPEYKPYVVELLAAGYLDHTFRFKSFKSEKKSIYRNANIELKRTVANQNKKKKSSYYGGNSKDGAYHNIFLDYYALMCGFRVNGHKDADQFFKDIYRIENKKFVIEAEIIHHRLGMPVDTAKINEVTGDLDYKIWAYNRLNDNDMLEYFSPDISQEDMAFAILYNYGYDEEEDTVVFLERILVDNGQDSGYVYFFKRKTEKKINWMIDYVGLQPSDEDSFETRGIKTKKGLAVKNDEEIELTIEKTLEIFELANRKRVVVTGYNFGGWGGLF